MKKIINILPLIVFFFLAIPLLAQVDRSKAPTPASAPKINIAEASHFTLKNGMKVYVVENRKLPRIAFSLTIDRDPLLEEDKAGYMAMVGEMMRAGTRNRSKAQLDEEIDFIAASLSTYQTGVFASSLKKHQDQLLTLMTDVLYNPSFPEEELEKIKKRTKSALAAAKDNPDAIASNVRAALVYGLQHPYGEISNEETVDNITLMDIRNYYDTYFKPNAAYLAIVGDITVKEAKKLTQKYFGNWEKGNLPKTKYEMPAAPEKTYVAIVDRPGSVQSVINISYPLELKPGSEDEIKARVLNQILGGGFSSRLMQNLREDKAYTYGARSSLSSDRIVGSFNASASVRNEVTDSAVYEFMYELEKIVKEGVTEDELVAAKASIAGAFGRSLESPQTIANFAINTARYNLPKDYYQTYLKKLEAITVEDIKVAADKYIKPRNAHIVIVGKSEEIAEGLAKFGEIKYFDFEAQPFDPAQQSAVPAGITAKTVLDKYIKAIGGKEAIEAISNLKIESDAEVMGQKLGIVLIKDQTNSRLLLEQKMQGMVLSKQVFNGTELKIAMQGQNIPATDEMIAKAKQDAKVIPELYFESLGIKTELNGMGKVGNKEAYKVKVIFPAGNTQTNYYDKTTGLKLREESTIQTPQGDMMVYSEMSNYQEVSGVLLPYATKIFQGMPITTTVTGVEVNIDLEDSMFN